MCDPQTGQPRVEPNVYPDAIGCASHERGAARRTCANQACNLLDGFASKFLMEDHQRGTDRDPQEQSYDNRAHETENSGLYLGDVVFPRNLPKPPRSGDICPRCRKGKLDYDGLLNLSCQECGYTLAGCFT